MRNHKVEKAEKDPGDGRGLFHCPDHRNLSILCLKGTGGNGILLRHSIIWYEQRERNRNMRFVIQCVDHAEVEIDNKVVGKIGKGFLVLIGICETDTRSTADRMAEKMLKLRIFEDENGKTNLNLASVGGELLLVSQFTLYADCRKGNRPSFVKAGSPQHAEELYEYLIAKCEELTHKKPETGEFGALMKVHLTNNGPFTMLMDSEELGY